MLFSLRKSRLLSKQSRVLRVNVVEDADSGESAEKYGELCCIVGNTNRKPITLMVLLEGGVVSMER